MTTSDEPGAPVRNVSDSTGLESDLDLPGLPAVAVHRSILTMGALMVAFSLMAVYGDTFVAGRLGAGISLLGLFGIVAVAPTLISRSIRPGPRDSHFRRE